MEQWSRISHSKGRPKRGSQESQFKHEIMNKKQSMHTPPKKVKRLALSCYSGQISPHTKKGHWGIWYISLTHIKSVKWFSYERESAQRQSRTALVPDPQAGVSWVTLGHIPDGTEPTERPVSPEQRKQKTCGPLLLFIIVIIYSFYDRFTQKVSGKRWLI